MSGLGGILGGLAIGAAITGVVSLIEYIATADERLREKATEAISAFNETENEIANVNDELEINKQRIEELSALENPTYVEQEELNKLKEVNGELETQKEYLEWLAENQKTAAQTAASEVMNNPTSDSNYKIKSEVERYSPGSGRQQTITVERDASPLEAITERSKDQTILLKKEESAYTDYLKAISGRNQEEIAKAKENLEAARGAIKENQEELAKVLSENQDFIDSLTGKEKKIVENAQIRMRAPEFKWDGSEMSSQIQTMVNGYAGFTKSSWDEACEEHPFAINKVLLKLNDETFAQNEEEVKALLSRLQAYLNGEIEFWQIDPPKLEWDSLGEEAQTYIQDTLNITKEQWESLIATDGIDLSDILKFGQEGFDKENLDLQTAIWQALVDANIIIEGNPLNPPSVQWGDLSAEAQMFLTSVMGFTEETWSQWVESHPLSAKGLIDDQSWGSLTADTQGYLIRTFGITEDTWNALVEQNPLMALAIKVQGENGWDETNVQLQALIQKAIDDANTVSLNNSLTPPRFDSAKTKERNTEAYNSGVEANEATQTGLDSKDVTVPTPSETAKESALTTFKNTGISMIDAFLMGMGIPSPNVVTSVVNLIKSVFSGGDGGSGGIVGALSSGLNDLVTGSLESASVGKTALTSAGISFPTIPGFRGPNKHKNGNRYAMDYPAALGTPIPALQGGTIVRVRTMKGSYGKHIYIAAPDGRTYVYAHMSRFANVAAGQPVRRGQVIGYVGSTGNSTGPHLHYGIAGKASGGVVNPNETTLAGEKGRELAVLPNGKIIMLGESGAGLYDLPPATRVVSNKDTEDVLKYTGKGIINQKVPKFASGNVDSAWVKNAQSIQSKYGIPASLVLAQLILESAWGTSDLAKNANNYFGMKGTGTAGKYGQYQKYNSMEESFEAYAKNLLNSGYYNVSGLESTDFNGWIDSIAETYAPNQNYASKVKGVASSYNLTQYDTGSSTSSSSSDEDYKAEIDKYYKYQLVLDDINTQLERNDKLETNAGENLTKKLKILAENIKLTEKERAALENIAKVKREDLKAQIEELRALGYDIAYNPETNYLSIQNYELLETLTGDTAKNQEEMIENMIELNKEIIEHSGAWWEAQNSIQEYINAMKEAREEQAQISKDIFQEFQESYINQYQYMIDDLEWAKENDELIKSLQEQLDILEEQEAALSGANDARAEAIALQKAEEALAKQQENIRIYREGQGFVYEKDQSETRDLEEEYSNAKIAYERAKLEAQIEAQEKIYDDAIDELQHVIDSWEHAIDVSNREQAMTIEEYVAKLKEYGLDTAENINNGVLWLEQAINTTNTVSDSINSMLNPIGASVEALKNLTNCLGSVQAALDELLNKSPGIDNGLIEEGQDYNSIVRSAMQKSKEWLAATDPNEKAKLHEEVMNILHNQLGLSEDENFNASTGVWSDKDGNALYDTQRGIIATEMKANSDEWATADATRRQELSALNKQLGSLAGFNYEASTGVWKTSDGSLAYLLPYKDKIAQMKQNSLDWYSANNSERVRLSNENMDIGNSIGLTYKNGVWYYQGQPVYTLTQEDFLNAMSSNAARWASASQSEKDRLSKGNQTLAAVYNSRFSDKLTHDSGTGIWYRSDGSRAFRDGGVVDYTGIANVHGSSSNPELILNSADVSKLYDYIHNTPSLISNMLAGLTNKNIGANSEGKGSIGDVVFNFNDGVHLHEVSSAEEVWDALCNDLPRIARQELMKRR